MWELFEQYLLNTNVHNKVLRFLSKFFMRRLLLRKVLPGYLADLLARKVDLFISRSVHDA